MYSANWIVRSYSYRGRAWWTPSTGICATHTLVCIYYVWSKSVLAQDNKPGKSRMPPLGAVVHKRSASRNKSGNYCAPTPTHITYSDISPTPTARITSCGRCSNRQIFRHIFVSYQISTEGVPVLLCSVQYVLACWRTMTRLKILSCLMARPRLMMCTL